MKSVLVIAFLSSSFASTIASYPFFGNCPNPLVVKDFNITKYAGVWYQVEKYFSTADATASCTAFKYKAEGIKRSEEMSFIQNTLYKWSGRRASIQGKAVFSGSKKHWTNRNGGRLITYLKSRAHKDIYHTKESYWILDTDYGNYSVVWSCKNNGIINFQNVMILTRTRSPSNYVLGLAYGAILSHGLSTKILVSVDQEECPDLFPHKSILKNRNKQLKTKPSKSRVSRDVLS